MGFIARNYHSLKWIFNISIWRVDIILYWATTSNCISQSQCLIVSLSNIGSSAKRVEAEDGAGDAEAEAPAANEEAKEDATDGDAKEQAPAEEAEKPAEEAAKEETSEAAPETAAE